MQSRAWPDGCSLGHNCPFCPRMRKVVRAENCGGRTTRVSGYPGRTPFSSDTVMPNASNNPRRPDAVTITARLCFILSVQPRSKQRLASATPTAPPMCCRRSVQSRQERKKRRRFVPAAKRSIPKSVRNRVPTGEVIVANPRVMKLLGLERQRSVSRSVFESDRHDPVEHLGDLRRRKTEIAVSPISYRGDQSRLGELSQMRTCRLRGDPSGIGKLGSRKSATVNKRGKHGRSRGLPDQPGNLGDERACDHVLNIAPHPTRGLERHFDGDRSDWQGIKVSSVAKLAGQYRLPGRHSARIQPATM